MRAKVRAGVRAALPDHVHGRRRKIKSGNCFWSTLWANSTNLIIYSGTMLLKGVMTTSSRQIQLASPKVLPLVGRQIGQWQLFGIDLCQKHRGFD